MRKEFIAITQGTWGRDVDAKEALIKALGNDANLKVCGTFTGVRLIEVEYPDNETDDDDITFYPSSEYRLTGKTKALHMDGNSILEFLEFSYGEES